MTVPAFVAVASGGDASGTNLVVSRPRAAVVNRMRGGVLSLRGGGRAGSAAVMGLTGVTAVADMPPVTADLGNETDRVAVADDAEARGFVFWLMPDDVVVEEMPPATAD